MGYCLLFSGYWFFKHAAQKHMQLVNSLVHTAWCFFWYKYLPQRKKSLTPTHHGPHIYLKPITRITRSFVLNLHVATSMLRGLTFASSPVNELLKSSFEKPRAAFSLCAETSHTTREDSSASFIFHSLFFHTVCKEAVQLNETGKLWWQELKIKKEICKYTKGFKSCRQEQLYILCILTKVLGSTVILQ